MFADVPAASNVRTNFNKKPIAVMCMAKQLVRIVIALAISILYSQFSGFGNNLEIKNKTQNAESAF